MEARWLGSATLRSGSLTHKKGNVTAEHETVSGELILNIKKLGTVKAFCVKFPVGDSISGALFSGNASQLTECSVPDGWQMSKETVDGLLQFSFKAENGVPVGDDIDILFERLICDTGEGISVVFVTYGDKTISLPVYRTVSDFDLSFYGDATGDFMSEIKIGWRAANMPSGTRLYLAPADTISGETELRQMEGELYFPLLCDVTYMLTARTNGNTVETLFHTVKVRPSEVLEFRAVPAEKGKLRIHFLLKNRRYAFLNMGIGRLDGNVSEKDGNIYSEYDGLITPVFKGEIPTLMWPPDFELSAAYLLVYGVSGNEKLVETRYGAIETSGKAITGFTFALENNAPDQTLKYNGSPEGLSISLSGSLNKTHDVVYRLRFESIGWLGWAKNGEKAGAAKSGLSCSGIEARLVKKGWAEMYVTASGQFPAFIDYGRAKAVASGKTLRDITVKLEGVPFGNTAVQSGHGLQITLTDGAEKLFDIYYRVVYPELKKLGRQSYTGWAKNGEKAGFLCDRFSESGVETKLTAKGVSAFAADEKQHPAFIDYDLAVVTVQTCSDGEWNPSFMNSEPELSESTPPLTGLRLIEEYMPGMDVVYKGCYTKSGWDEQFQSGGLVAERSGEFLEGVQVKPDGENAGLFDLACRVGFAKIGWLGWNTDGGVCGVIGQGLPAAAIDVRLLPPGGAAQYPKGDVPSSFGMDASVDCKVFSGKAWTAAGRGVSGTAADYADAIGGIKLRLNGFGKSTLQIALNGEDEWRDAALGFDTKEAPDGAPPKTVRIRLTDMASVLCDIIYRVYLPGRGWLGWAANGEAAGSDLHETYISAIELNLLAKGLIDGDESIHPAFLAAAGCDVKCLAYDGQLWTPSEAVRELPVTGLRFGIKGIHHSLEDTVRLWLDKSICDGYELFYRARVTGLGWLGWAKNGQQAGTSEKAIDGLEVKLIPKGGDVRPFDSEGLPSFVDYKTAKINEELLVDGVWLDPRESPEFPENLQKIQGFRLTVSGAEGISVEYKGYYARVGWDTEWTAAGEMCCGNTRLEAVQFRKTGAAAHLYELFCRLRLTGYGWLGWSREGMAGIIRDGQSCTDMEFRLKPKGSVTEGVHFNRPPFFADMRELKLNCAYSNGNGKINLVSGRRICLIGADSDTAKPLTGFQIRIDGAMGCTAEYKSCLTTTGWDMLWSSCPKELDMNAPKGEGFIEAVKIQLNKGADSMFGISYRAYIKGVGWTRWTSGGEDAGIAGSGQGCTAIEVKLKRIKNATFRRRRRYYG